MFQRARICAFMYRFDRTCKHLLDKSASWQRLALVALTLVASLVTAGAQTNKGPGTTPPPSVIVDTARARDFSEQWTFTGRVEAIDKVAIRARITGFLRSRGFEEGAEVAKDQVLFELEKEPYEAALALAQANLDNTRAALELAQATFDRVKPLADKGTASLATLDDARSKLSQAMAALAAQEANLTKAKIDLSYTEIRAPMSGRTGRASYALGEYVGPSSNPLVTLVRQDPMYVAFPVPQRVLLTVRREGRDADSVLVRLKLPDGSNYEFDGGIKFAEVEGSAGTDSVLVRASVANPKRLLVDQQIVGVSVVSKEPERKLVISQAALLLDQQGASVLVVNAKDQIESRRVELGEQREPDVVVVKGLVAGERVVVSGHQKARPGTTVEAHQSQSLPTATTR
jgi:membrane fusion protein, multidrug efflux system